MFPLEYGKMNFNGGGSSTNDYNESINKPKINNVELIGNKELSDFGIRNYDSELDSYYEYYGIKSLNGCTVQFGVQTKSLIYLLKLLFMADLESLKSYYDDMIDDIRTIVIPSEVRISNYFTIELPYVGKATFYLTSDESGLDYDVDYIEIFNYSKGFNIQLGKQNEELVINYEHNNVYYADMRVTVNSAKEEIGGSWISGTELENYNAILEAFNNKKRVIIRAQGAGDIANMIFDIPLCSRIVDEENPGDYVFDFTSIFVPGGIMLNCLVVKEGIVSNYSPLVTTQYVDNAIGGAIEGSY